MSDRIDLSTIDLNLLPKFRALYRQRNVSEAGRELHLTQSALSNALARMRALFSDELFVRTQTGMEPTPLAHAIAVPIANALKTLETEFSQLGRFSPERSSRVFKIAMTQLSELWLAPHILSLAQSVAPHIVVSTVVAGDRGFEAAMARGSIDFAVGDFSDLGEGLRSSELAMHEIVCMLREGHPMLQGPLSIDSLLSCTFAEIVEHDVINRVFERFARAGAMRYRTSNVMALPHVIAATDLVAIVPGWFAERYSRLGLRFVRIGGKPTVATIRLVWHEHFEADPGHLWMRSVIGRAAAAAQVDEVVQDARLVRNGARSEREVLVLEEVVHRGESV